MTDMGKFLKDRVREFRSVVEKASEFNDIGDISTTATFQYIGENTDDLAIDIVIRKRNKDEIEGE